ncbi:hypothetical protein T07_4787 [Trichinella nelsoni]|uniref:Uncharacterized protein n=1 Tax=Trichinella nelsoni TaxID=6336 RepID=A0A0V0RV54_9BILA|nr:hypothetical protein T07_4787 [Trichinella nelsoni]
MVIHAGRCHPAGVKTLIVKEKRENLHQPVPGPGKVEALQPTGTVIDCRSCVERGRSQVMKHAVAVLCRHTLSENVLRRKRLSQNSLLLDDDLEQKLAYTVADGLQEK